MGAGFCVNPTPSPTAAAPTMTALTGTQTYHLVYHRLLVTGGSSSSAVTVRS